MEFAIMSGMNKSDIFFFLCSFLNQQFKKKKTFVTVDLTGNTIPAGLYVVVTAVLAISLIAHIGLFVDVTVVLAVVFAALTFKLWLI